MISFSDETIKIIDYITAKFGIAIDWSADNIMPTLQELAAHYLKWEISTSIMWIALGVIVMIPGLMLITKAIKSKDVEDMFGYGCCSLLFFIISFGIIFAQAYDIIKCVNFPELQIFEYLTTTLKNMK